MLAELRRYRFADEEETERERHGLHCETAERQDFGPSLLLSVPLVTSQSRPLVNEEEGDHKSAPSLSLLRSLKHDENKAA